MFISCSGEPGNETIILQQGVLDPSIFAVKGQLDFLIGSQEGPLVLDLIFILGHKHLLQDI